MDESDIVLRISAKNHGSGIHKSAKIIASLFNWQQLGDEFSGGQQRAIPISTTSAESSLTDLLERRAELAILRADLADQIFAVSNESSSLDAGSLRLVSTHTPEFLHIIVRGDHDGATVKSLDGKRINIGASSETAHRDFKKLLADAGCYVPEMDFVYAPVADGLQRLESGTVDAVIFFDQAPSNLVAEKLENLEYRLLHFSVIRDGAISRPAANPVAQYFSNSSSAEFYTTPQHVRSLTRATYLLTRNDVQQTSIDPIVQLLNIQPQLDINISAGGAETQLTGDLASKAQQKVADMHLRPYTISETLSPIPLHPSSQLLIDIFADPATLGSRNNDAARSASSVLAEGQSE